MTSILNLSNKFHYFSFKLKNAVVENLKIKAESISNTQLEKFKLNIQLEKHSDINKDDVIPVFIEITSRDLVKEALYYYKKQLDSYLEKIQDEDRKHCDFFVRLDYTYTFQQESTKWVNIVKKILKQKLE